MKSPHPDNSKDSHRCSWRQVLTFCRREPRYIGIERWRLPHEKTRLHFQVRGSNGHDQSGRVTFRVRGIRRRAHGLVYGNAIILKAADIVTSRPPARSCAHAPARVTRLRGASGTEHSIAIWRDRRRTSAADVIGEAFCRESRSARRGARRRPQPPRLLGVRRRHHDRPRAHARRARRSASRSLHSGRSRDSGLPRARTASRSSPTASPFPAASPCASRSGRRP